MSAAGRWVVRATALRGYGVYCVSARGFNLEGTTVQRGAYVHTDKAKAESAAKNFAGRIVRLISRAEAAERARAAGYEQGRADGYAAGWDAGHEAATEGNLR